jgi:signal transduction histidine kinase
MEDPAFRTLSDVVLTIAGEHRVEPVLQRLVHAARELAGARYAALGVPDGAGGFTRFITSGMTDAEIAAMGPLPRQHGLLGAMLESPEPYRTPDIHTHPRFRGWWPAGHPDMRSFLGVPIVAAGQVIGALYLTDKVDAPHFGAEDQAQMELLAAHAAMAIENARLHERSRELSIVEERNRLARELHDAVAQKLFAVVLAAESAATLLGRDRAATAAELERAQGLAREAMTELRSLIFELRPPALEAEGLAVTLRKHVEVLRRTSGQDVVLRADGVPRLPAESESEVLRVAQEALQNAVRHAGARRVEVRLSDGDGRLVLEVSDDGAGFDPAAPEVRSRRLGLTSMEERAEALGGSLAIESAPGRGTRVRLEVPA